MLIRVAFGDNDFSLPIRDACEAIVQDISRGYGGDLLIKKFRDHLEKYVIEDVRQRIVVGATGFCLARDGARGRFESFEALNTESILAAYHNTLNYLNKIVKIAVVRHYNKNDDNCEACYIDLYKNVVVEC
jgi:hypothetical protein